MYGEAGCFFFFFSTGTAGFGYVTVCPFRCMFNNAEGINFTLVNFSGTVVDFLNAGNSRASTNSQYADTATAAQFQGRLVACGLRVRNVSALLAKGGSLIGFEALNHENAVGTTVTTAMLMDTTERLPATSESWSSVVWHPADDDEFDYFSAPEIDAVPQSNSVLTFIAQSTAAQPQNYEFEVYCAFEAKGTIVHGLTPSYGDPAGLAAVQNLSATPAARKPTQKSTAATVSSQLSAFGRAVDTAAGVAQSVVQGVQLFDRYIAPYAPPAYQAIRGALRGARTARFRAPAIAARADCKAVLFPVVLYQGNQLLGSELGTVSHGLFGPVTAQSADGHPLSGISDNCPFPTFGPLTFSCPSGVIISGRSHEFAVFVLLFFEFDGLFPIALSGAYDATTRSLSRCDGIRSKLQAAKAEGFPLAANSFLADIDVSHPDELFDVH